MNLQPKRYRLFASLAAPALAAAVILPVIEAESAQAADVAVLDTGDVRLATKLVDGVLSQDLMVVDSTGAFERFDLESTVISIPNSEPWPGGVSVLSREAWEAWVPDHGPVWRTLSRLNPERGAPVANPLTVSFDTGFIPWSGYALDLELTTVAIGQIQTTGEGRVVVHRGATVMRLANELAIDQKLVSQPGTGVPGGFSDAIAYTGDPDIGVISRNLGQPSSSNGFIFTAPGVYCVTATTETTTAAGKTLRNAAAYTFAVGTDPTEVQACAQPVNIDEPEGPEPGDQIGFTDRVASGVNVALAARLNDGQLALGGYIAGQEATWFDPRATVINIPLRDQQAWPLPELAPQSGFQNEWRMVGEAGEHLFRTNPGMLSQVPEHGNPIEVRPDASFVTAVMVTTNVTFELGTVEGPTGGRLTSFRIPDNGTKSQLGTPTQNSYWNSADRFWNRAVEMPPGNGAYQGAIGAVPNTGSGLGLAFNEPGRYCVTVRASAGWRSTGQVQQAWQTYTFAVGVEPSSVALCAARQDGVVERGDPNEGLTPDVVYLRNGHTDIGTRVVDGALALYVGDETTGSERLADPQDVVIVGNGPLVESTVVNDGEVDTRLMGEPGDTYWIFREDGSTSPWVVWPGLNTMQTGGNAFDRTVDFRILGVDGPGEFVLAGSDAFLKDSPGDIIYASNPDVPRPFSRPLARTHIHLNWLFSEPGRYCVNIEANARGVTGAGSRDTATDLITFVVGDVDLRGIIPCARSGSGAAAVTDPVPAISVAPTPTPIQVNATAGAVPATLFQTALYLDQGNLAVASAYSDSAHSPTVWRDPERFVLTVSGRVLTRIENSLTAGPLRGLVEDDIEMRLGELRGPGWYRFYGTGLSLDSGTGEMAGTLWPGWTMRVSDRFETTGVYCVPVTWSATVAGESQSVSKTLTYVANTAAPGDEGYLDPAGVELCAGQESGPDPGEGDDNGDSNPGEGPEDPAWDVPNGTINAAGVTIVNNGHVDIASRLDNGELVTLIKDDSTGAAAPVYRDPAKTLLQVLPEAQTSVPDSAAYSFLGEPGADIWLLPQTQQEGLLWPGWSTELIAPGLAPGGIEWTLTGVDGPGSFALFQTGAFGQATVLWNSADGIDQTDSFVIPEATHAHGAWAFSAEGIYCLAFDRTARLAGSETTASGVLAVAVGRADPTEVDPAACFTDPGDDPGDEPGDGPGVTPSVAITNFAAGYVDGQSYTLTAEHSPAIDGATYRWELLQTGAQTWYTIRDAQGIVTTANLTFTAQQAWDGFAWRVALLDADGVRVAESASHEMRVSLPTQTGDGLHILGLAGHYHSSAPVTLTAALVPAETADATYRWSVQRADQARPQVVAGVSGDVLTLTAEQALNGATVSVERLVAGVVTHTSAVVTIAVDDHGAPAPQAVSVASEPLYTAGATVTLTASVTPTTALDRFQWYVKAPAADAATPVPGATSATYTFVATAGHDGAEVSVAVLGEDGQVVYGPSVAVRLAVSPLGDDEPGDEPGDEEPGGSERGDEEPGGEEPLDPKAPSDRDDSLPPTGVPAAGWMPLTVLTCLALGMVLAVWSRRTRTANPEGPGAS